MTTTNPLLLAQMLGRLEALGVEVPGAANYRTLLAALREAPQPPRSMLDMTPEQVTEHIRENVRNETSRKARVDSDTIRAEATLAGEFLQSMGSNFDLIVTQLAPVFDAAAKSARWLDEAGVTPRDNFESLFMRPRAVRMAWLEFRNTHSGRLDDILQVLNDLAEGTHVLPQVGGAHTDMAGGVFMARNYWAGMLARERAEGAWCRWLRVASHLHLTTLADLNHSERLRASGVDVPSLISPAIRQLAHDLAEAVASND
jgi:hypothetical protein